MLNKEMTDAIPSEFKPRTKEEIDQDYSKWAMLAGDAYVKMKFHENVLQDCMSKAMKTVTESHDLARYQAENNTL